MSITYLWVQSSVGKVCTSDSYHNNHFNFGNPLRIRKSLFFVAIFFLISCGVSARPIPLTIGPKNTTRLAFPDNAR